MHSGRKSAITHVLAHSARPTLAAYKPSCTYQHVEEARRAQCIHKSGAFLFSSPVGVIITKNKPLTSSILFFSILRDKAILYQCCMAWLQHRQTTPLYRETLNNHLYSSGHNIVANKSWVCVTAFVWLCSRTKLNEEFSPKCNKYTENLYRDKS